VSEKKEAHKTAACFVGRLTNDPCAIGTVGCLVEHAPPADSPETQERGWQDIATAPKDGTPILGFMPSYYQGKGGQSVIMWMDGQWFDNRAFATEPARWQPLPSPPAQTEDSK
jgi:hypothetical protein